jgi:hypothetical protein
MARSSSAVAGWVIALPVLKGSQEGIEDLVAAVSL